MSKGYNKNKERLDHVALPGPPLIRRAKKRCGLCKAQAWLDG